MFMKGGAEAGFNLFKVVLAILPGAIAYLLAKALGPLFPLGLGVAWILSAPENKSLALKVCGGVFAVEVLFSAFWGWGGGWWLSLLSAIGILVMPPSFSGRILRGTSLTTSKGLQRQLAVKGAKYLKQSGQIEPTQPQLEIAGIKLPNYLENLGFFFVGSPGSGKTQAITQMLALMRQRSDFRVICLDRNAELLERFFSEERDIIFNPKDSRSIGWSHVSEKANPETIAASLIPDDPKDRFFSEAAKSLISDIYERVVFSICRSFISKEDRLLK
jgi:hypothetical protein